MDVKEKLVELANDVLQYLPWGEIQKDTAERIADRMMDHGVTVQEWISVTEWLPEVATSHNTRWDKSTDSIRVLCACVQADGKKMVKEGYCKVYSDGYVHWKIPGTIHSVTHWQYLPQPPKGE